MNWVEKVDMLEKEIGKDVFGVSEDTVHVVVGFLMDSAVIEYALAKILGLGGEPDSADVKDRQFVVDLVKLYRKLFIVRQARELFHVDEFTSRALPRILIFLRTAHQRSAHITQSMEVPLRAFVVECVSNMIVQNGDAARYMLFKGDILTYFSEETDLTAIHETRSSRREAISILMIIYNISLLLFEGSADGLFRCVEAKPLILFTANVVHMSSSGCTLELDGDDEILWWVTRIYRSLSAETLVDVLRMLKEEVLFSMVDFSLSLSIEDDHCRYHQNQCFISFIVRDILGKYVFMTKETVEFSFRVPSLVVVLRHLAAISLDLNSDEKMDKNTLKELLMIAIDVAKQLNTSDGSGCLVDCLRIVSNLTWHQHEFQNVVRCFLDQIQLNFNKITVNSAGKLVFSRIFCDI